MATSKKEEPYILAPASQPQADFLASDATITLYAGAMGAGKSFAIVLNMVKFAAKKNSTIVCFRRTLPELKAPGGIWREATAIFKKMFKDCKIRSNDLEIYVPSTNSIVKFQGLQYQSDVDKALGAQYSAIFFDEAVTFEPFEQFVLPLLGRLRSANVDYTPQMFWATNPRFNHGIYHWIKDFYLDEYGIPIKEKSNTKRWFILSNDKPIWFDTEQAALDYCATLPTIGGEPIRPKSFTAIRAHVTDNVPLCKNNPDYISNLQAMPEVRRRIYLDGSWTAREEEAGLYLRSWSKVVPFAPPSVKKRVRAYDLASQPVSTQSPNPDWSRGILVSKGYDNKYTVEDLVSLRDRPLVVENLILDTARRDGPSVIVVYPIDPGQAGVARASEMKMKLAEMGVRCILIRPSQAKRVRFLPASAIAEAGYVDVVRADWNDEFFDELEEFTGLKRGERDDICDAFGDAIRALNQGIELPDFTLPDLSGSPSGIVMPSYSFTNTSFPSFPSFNI
jgi:predicted phage terminase large subunit-like protein